MSVWMERLTHVKPASDAGRRPVGRRMRRIGLWVFFLSVGVNAALGIYAVLAPDFDETQGKILFTSLCVTGAVLVALACEPAWEGRVLGPVPLAGTGLGAVAAALGIATIWTEPASDAWGKAIASVMAVTAGLVLASLLGLTRLAPRHDWVRRTTFALLAVGTALWATLPWLEDPAEWVMRGFGVVMIALAAFLVTVPVIHWLDRGEVASTAAVTAEARFCPYCAAELPVADGDERECGRCGREFAVVARTTTRAST